MLTHKSETNACTCVFGIGLFGVVCGGVVVVVLGGWVFFNECLFLFTSIYIFILFCRVFFFAYTPCLRCCPNAPIVS